jgi:Holliday junction resolvasome RuvABC DNA-binding subunit
MTDFRKKHVEKKKKRKSKPDIKWSKKCVKRQNYVKKLLKNCQKVAKKLCQRIVTKLSKNWLGMEKVSFGLTGAAWNGGSRFGPV